jgi:DNA-binding beta-propeller fold protein YncE
VLGAVSLTASPATAACQGSGAPASGHTRCVTAIAIPGNPLQSFDISWVDPKTSRYYLADRANAGIDVIDTSSLAYMGTLGGFVGIVIKNGAVDNSHSGPDGVTTHGRWLYAGDGNSTLKVFDLLAPTASALKQTISTGGTTRVDEMALTADGKLLLAVNNAEDPPFGTFFKANGDAASSSVSAITKVTIDPTILPPNNGLGFEQSVWDPQTQRFYASLPSIANNPPGCVFPGLAPAAAAAWW